MFINDRSDEMRQTVHDYVVVLQRNCELRTCSRFLHSNQGRTYGGSQGGTSEGGSIWANEKRQKEKKKLKKEDQERQIERDNNCLSSLLRLYGFTVVYIDVLLCVF